VVKCPDSCSVSDGTEETEVGCLTSDGAKADEVDGVGAGDGKGG